MSNETMRWRKSSYSGAGGGDNECVEVASSPVRTHVRDTKDRDGGALAFPAADWSAFLGEVTDAR